MCICIYLPVHIQLYTRIYRLKHSDRQTLLFVSVVVISAKLFLFMRYVHFVLLLTEQRINENDNCDTEDRMYKV